MSPIIETVQTEGTEETEEVTTGYNWYLLVPTELLGNGSLKIVVTAHVPDSDFAEVNPDTELAEGGYRREIAVQGLGTIKKIV